MTTPPDPTVPPGAPVEAAPRRPVIVWDVILTIVLLAGLAVVAAGLSFAGVMLVMSSDSCGVTTTCDTTLIGLGTLLGVALPWVAVVAAVIFSIVRMVLRRLAFWVPLAAVPLAIGGLAIGAAVAFAGAGGT